MLGRRYTPMQWLSLFVLGLGVACIQLAPKPNQSEALTREARNSEWRSLASRPSRSQMVGLLAVIISCFASAFAATYFELLLKKPAATAIGDATAAQPVRVPSGRLSVQLESNLPYKQIGNRLAIPDLGGRRHTVAWHTSCSQPAVPQVIEGQHQAPATPSLWIKNIQLALFSLLSTIAYNFLASSGSSSAFIATFFDGFNAFTWSVIAIQAIGGLLTALVVGAFQKNCL